LGDHENVAEGCRKSGKKLRDFGVVADSLLLYRNTLASNKNAVKGNVVVNVAQADGPYIVGVGNWTGRQTPLYCAS
jgi:hypothetical protein